MGSWTTGRGVGGTQVRMLRAISALRALIALRLDPSIQKHDGTGIQMLNTKNLVTCPGILNSAPLKVALCHGEIKLVDVTERSNWCSCWNQLQGSENCPGLLDPCIQLCPGSRKQMWGFIKPPMHLLNLSMCSCAIDLNYCICGYMFF